MYLQEVEKGVWGALMWLQIEVFISDVIQIFLA
jgi:hypothetical protein